MLQSSPGPMWGLPWQQAPMLYRSRNVVSDDRPGKVAEAVGSPYTGALSSEYASPLALKPVLLLGTLQEQQPFEAAADVGVALLAVLNTPGAPLRRAPKLLQSIGRPSMLLKALRRRGIDEWRATPPGGRCHHKARSAPIPSFMLPRRHFWNDPASGSFPAGGISWSCLHRK